MRRILIWTAAATLGLTGAAFAQEASPPQQANTQQRARIHRDSAASDQAKIAKRERKQADKAARQASKAERKAGKKGEMQSRKGARDGSGPIAKGGQRGGPTVDGGPRGAGQSRGRQGGRGR